MPVPGLALPEEGPSALVPSRRPGRPGAALESAQWAEEGLRRGKKGPHMPETGGADDRVQLGSAAPVRRGKVMAGLGVLVLGQRLPAQEARLPPQVQLKMGSNIYQKVKLKEQRDRLEVGDKCLTAGLCPACVCV